MPERIYLSLGSNIAPEENLPRCVALLSERSEIIAVSRVFETAPVGFEQQANFFNAAVLIETDLDPATLKVEVLSEIENILGRVRTPNKNAPRTIDIDIALFNRDILELAHRHIPDPDILDYGHIALPLADVDAEYRHPETGQTLAEIAAPFADDPAIRVRSDIDLAHHIR